MAKLRLWRNRLSAHFRCLSAPGDFRTLLGIAGGRRSGFLCSLPWLVYAIERTFAFIALGLTAAGS